MRRERRESVGRIPTRERGERCKLVAFNLTAKETCPGTCSGQTMNVEKGEVTESAQKGNISCICVKALRQV
jgi:hypothetical protein